MGIYYICVCEETREFIDPARIGGGAIKFSAILEGPTANIVMFAMMTHWRGKHVRFVDDTSSGDGDLYYDVQRWAVLPEHAASHHGACSRCHVKLRQCSIDTTVFMEPDARPHTQDRCLTHAPLWSDITPEMVEGYNKGLEGEERITLLEKKR